MNIIPKHTQEYATGRADFERKVLLSIEGVPVFEERVVVERSCYCEQALNVKNFVKRLKRKGIYDGR